MPLNNYLLNLETTPNQGNVTSVDSYVLKNKKLAGLRQFIEDLIFKSLEFGTKIRPSRAALCTF